MFIVILEFLFKSFVFANNRPSVVSELLNDWTFVNGDVDISVLQYDNFQLRIMIISKHTAMELSLLMIHGALLTVSKLRLMK
jgi:hypothetical protein